MSLELIAAEDSQAGYQPEEQQRTKTSCLLLVRHRREQLRHLQRAA
jgi:hypothetical protein